MTNLATLLSKTAVYNFVNSLHEESKYCSDVTEKGFKKELVMTKKDNEDFENPTKCWICDKNHVDGDYCHITGKYGCEYRLQHQHQI